MSKKQIVEPTELKLDDMKKVVGGTTTRRTMLRGGGENNQGNDNSQGDEPGRVLGVFKAK
jgi:hypothetical protein